MLRRAKDSLVMLHIHWILRRRHSWEGFEIARPPQWIAGLALHQRNLRGPQIPKLKEHHPQRPETSKYFPERGYRQNSRFWIRGQGQVRVILFREKFQDMNIGSPFYMAPEAFIANTYGSKTDVWSFGIILYELLHAKTPFWEIQDAESLHSRITVPIKRENFRPEISYELRDLILRCL